MPELTSDFQPMQLLVTKTALHSYTILHLLGWIESLSYLMNTEDWPFDSVDELAYQLEVWRAEFEKTNSEIITSEPVTISIYGKEVILIANEKTGEHILFTYIPSIPCLEKI